MSINLAPCIVFSSEDVTAGVELVSPEIQIPVNRQRLTFYFKPTVAMTVLPEIQLAGSWVAFLPAALALPANVLTSMEVYNAVSHVRFKFNAAVDGKIMADVGVTANGQ